MRIITYQLYRTDRNSISKRHPSRFTNPRNGNLPGKGKSSISSAHEPRSRPVSTSHIPIYSAFSLFSRKDSYNHLLSSAKKVPMDIFWAFCFAGAATRPVSTSHFHTSLHEIKNIFWKSIRKKDRGRERECRDEPMIAVGWNRKCAGETVCVRGLDLTQERKVKSKEKRGPNKKTNSRWSESPVEKDKTFLKVMCEGGG